MPKVLTILLVILPTIYSNCIAQSNNRIFMKMAGESVAMDSTFNVRFLRQKPGMMHSVDTDNDGRIDVIYRIDNDDKHQGKRSPLLVKIVDEDGDMYLSGEGDQDSDLYVADWYGDGTIDRLVDYNDTDGDNDVDEQYLYQWIEMEYPYFSPRTYNGRSYCVVFARDIGDDSRLWYHVNYEYNQRLTQWLTDFNGDEMFVYPFYFDYESGSLTPACEIAFSFYDLDGDSLSEEAVRFEGAGLVAENLRYSMDIDNDATEGNRHDYDFSITSLGPMELPLERCSRFSIRGITAGPVFEWREMRRFAREQHWGRTLLTWDENDNNIDPRPGRMHHERWEGILNHPSEYMPQVGGPTCGPYNKRNEVDSDRSGKFGFYYSPVDRRLHLLGAETGWINVDYDYNDTVDMVIRTEDVDRDGFFDTWKYDVDGNGAFEYIFNVPYDSATVYPFEYVRLHKAYLPVLEKARNDNLSLIEAMKSVLGEKGIMKTADPVEKYFNEELLSYGLEFRLGEKIGNSLEGQRYYSDLVRIRYWSVLLENKAVSGETGFAGIQKAYEEGRFDEAAEMLENIFLD